MTIRLRDVNAILDDYARAVDERDSARSGLLSLAVDAAGYRAMCDHLIKEKGELHKRCERQQEQIRALLGVRV